MIQIIVLEHKKCNLIIIIVKGFSSLGLNAMFVIIVVKRTRILFVGNGEWKCHNNIVMMLKLRP